jgi:hypothetical protein
MAHLRQRNQGVGQKVMSAVGAGLQFAGTAKALFDVGRTVYNVARTVAPVVAAIL